jgi:hypothetical protein
MVTNSIVHTFRYFRSSILSTTTPTTRKRKTRRIRRTTGNIFPSFIFIGLVLLICFCCCWTEQVVSAQFAEIFDAIGALNDVKKTNFNSTTATSIITNTTTNANANTTINNTYIPSGDIVSRPSNAKAADSILYPWFVQLLGCCSLFVLTRFNCPIPYAAIMFIWGAIMGIAVSFNEDPDGTTYEDGDNRNYMEDSVIAWINIDSATLLLVFLPGLIFKDAVEIPINLFQVAIGKLFVCMLYVVCCMLYVVCGLCAVCY